MTIDTKDREAAVRRALKRLADLCGDAQGLNFGAADLAEAKPFATTLAELEAAGYVEMVAFASNQEPYTLTLEGWVEAQKVSGRLESPEFDRRRGRLCQVMKDAVKGRADERLLEVSEVAERAGLPVGWVCNILETELLDRLDPQGRYRVRVENGLVWIPVTFGQEPVNLA